MSRWLVAGALLGCWGCAFSLDGPSPNRPRNRVPVCDTSKGLVALDGVMAAALGVATLSIASEEPAAALIPLGIGALYLGGAVSGNRTVNKCREAIADYEGSYGDERYADQDDDDPSPGRLIPRSKTARAGQPSDPYAGQPAYPPNNPAYPPPQPAPQPTYPPPTQPTYTAPAQPAAEPQQPPPPPQSPAKRPPSPPPESDGDWSDFWREVP